MSAKKEGMTLVHAGSNEDGSICVTMVIPAHLVKAKSIGERRKQQARILKRFAARLEDGRADLLRVEKLEVKYQPPGGGPLP